MANVFHVYKTGWFCSYILKRYMKIKSALFMMVDAMSSQLKS